MQDEGCTKGGTPFQQLMDLKPKPSFHGRLFIGCNAAMTIKPSVVRTSATALVLANPHQVG